MDTQLVYSREHGLQVPQTQHSGLLDRLAHQGYVTVQLDPATVQLLGEVSQSDAVAARLDVQSLPGQVLISRPYPLRPEDSAPQPAKASAIDQASAALNSIAQSVLRAVVSAPDSIGNATDFETLLDKSPPGTSVLCVHKYRTTEDDYAAQDCTCHDWQRDTSVMTAVWSQSGGLEVKVNGDTQSVPHGSGAYVTCFPGLTLQAALLGTIRATEYREVYTGTPRTSLAFKLQLPHDTVLDASLLRVQPITVKQLCDTYHNSRAQHAQRADYSPKTPAAAAGSGAAAAGHKRPLQPDDRAPAAKRLAPSEAAAAAAAAAIQRERVTRGLEPAAEAAAASPSPDGDAQPGKPAQSPAALAAAAGSQVVAMPAEGAAGAQPASAPGAGASPAQAQRTSRLAGLRSQPPTHASPGPAQPQQPTSLLAGLRVAGVGQSPVRGGLAKQRQNPPQPLVGRPLPHEEPLIPPQHKPVSRQQDSPSSHHEDKPVSEQQNLAQTQQHPSPPQANHHKHIKLPPQHPLSGRQHATQHPSPPQAVNNNDRNNNNANQSVRLTVLSPDGGEVHFSIKTTTRLWKVIKAYCGMKGVGEDRVQLVYGDTTVAGEHTPASLGMDDGDILIASLLPQQHALIAAGPAADPAVAVPAQLPPNTAAQPQPAPGANQAQTSRAAQARLVLPQRPAPAAPLAVPAAQQQRAAMAPAPAQWPPAAAPPQPQEQRPAVAPVTARPAAQPAPSMATHVWPQQPMQRNAAGEENKPHDDILARLREMQKEWAVSMAELRAKVLQPPQPSPPRPQPQPRDQWAAAVAAAAQPQQRPVHAAALQAPPAQAQHALPAARAAGVAAAAAAPAAAAPHRQHRQPPAPQPAVAVHPHAHTNHHRHNYPVHILVLDPAGNELHFNVTAHTKLGQVMAQYCARARVDPNRVRFVHYGYAVEEDDTPAGLEMAPHDVLAIYTC